jgi:murein DD-endopeptidase MepM/ murein hydrolase activator NlpD
LGSSIFINAQPFFAKKNYPTTFQNPVDIPISIVGNFGECRPNHFHSGLDIRTGGKENQIVRSTADGYVSRVNIGAGEFGNAIYITHGAYTTLYAHLNKFYPELENYIKAQQYKKKNWNMDILFLPHQFPVRKGAFIAWSGNTGSSEGPHLHLRGGGRTGPFVSQSEVA